MKRYVLSPHAQADLSDIWDYTAERWGSAQAETYLRQLQASIEAVAASPQRGTACSDIRPGYYRYPSGSHLLFYKAADQGIDVVRILHMRMDFTRHL